MAIKIEDLLAELDSAQEKTAAQLFTEGLVAEPATTKQASAPAEPAPAEPTPAEPAPTTEKKATDITGMSEEELVKTAQDFGKIAAYSFFNELAELGIKTPNNGDVEVPPVSAVSRPTASPVTIAGDADVQEAVGHDGYDKLDAIKAKITPDRVKQASVVDSEFLTNLYNKLY